MTAVNSESMKESSALGEASNPIDQGITGCTAGHLNAPGLVLFYFIFLQTVLVCPFRSSQSRVFFPHDVITARFLPGQKRYF